MFAARRDRVDDEVRDRFVRVVGLPELDDDGVTDRGVPDGGSGVGGPLVVTDPSTGGVRGVLGAFDPGRRGIRALAVVAVVAVAAAAFLAWRARPQPETVAATPDPPAPTVSSGVVVVAVTGRVRRPGLVRLPAGARVADAIDAAGGALPDTDLSLVNLARKLVDGELVAVGITVPAGTVVGGTAVGGPPGAPAGGQLNINSATAAQFEALPGIGPVLAQHMVDYRTRHGQFRSVEELRQVDGLGAARYNQIKDLVTV